MDPIERMRRLKRLQRIARLMDSRFHIPFTKVRFGLDGLIGLIPGAGDVVALGASFYIIQQAREMGVSQDALLRMIANASVDFALGLVPVVGDVADIVFKANNRNLKILEKELSKDVIDV